VDETAPQLPFRRKPSASSGLRHPAESVHCPFVPCRSCKVTGLPPVRCAWKRTPFNRLPFQYTWKHFQQASCRSLSHSPN